MKLSAVQIRSTSFDLKSRILHGVPMFYTYVLLSLKDNKYYIGYTSDLRKRIKEHFSGKSFATKSRLPFKLIFYEAFENKEDTLRREKYFKTNSGKKTLKLMLRSHNSSSEKSG